MFSGQPYCESCGYEGPNFTWMWHHSWGFEALVQHRESLALRVVPVPDDPVFDYREGRNPGEKTREDYVTSVVRSQLRPGERHVLPAEFARFAGDGEEQRATDLPSPRCGALLLWRHTGIS